MVDLSMLGGMMTEGFQLKLVKILIEHPDTAEKLNAIAAGVERYAIAVQAIASNTENIAAHLQMIHQQNAAFATEQVAQKRVLDALLNRSVAPIVTQPKGHPNGHDPEQRLFDPRVEHLGAITGTGSAVNPT
jgi:hypothetical protein